MIFINEYHILLEIFQNVLVKNQNDQSHLNDVLHKIASFVYTYLH